MADFEKLAKVLFVAAQQVKVPPRMGFPNAYRISIVMQMFRQKKLTTGGLVVCDSEVSLAEEKARAMLDAHLPKDKGPCEDKS
jgi:hypothetical protein